MLTDEEIVRLIAEGHHRSRDYGDYLYLQYCTCNRKYVLSNSGCEADVTDNYHEGFIVVMEKIKGGNFPSTATFGGYLFSVCRNLWLKELKRRKKNVTIDVTNTDALEQIDEEAVDIFDSSYDRVLMKAIKKLTKRCIELLEKFYFEKKKDDEIYSALDYKTPAALRQKRSRCVKDLRSYYKALI